MKRLLTFLVLWLPLYLFSQGFGSFSHDQPFFAKDRGSDVSRFRTITYDANLLLLSDGDPVSNFTDQSSYHYDALQGTAGNMPYWTNNVGEINNNGYIVFDGVNDSVRTNFSTIFAQPESVFFVAQIPIPDSAYRLYFGNVGIGQGFASQSYFASWAGVYGAITNTTVTNWTIFEFGFNGTNSYWRTNGVLAWSGNAGTNGRQGMIFGQDPGGTGTAAMKVAYLTLYTNLLTLDDTRTITATLSSRFGISCGIPQNIPYWNPLYNSSLLSLYNFSDLNVGQTAFYQLTNSPDFGNYSYTLTCSNTFLNSSPTILFGGAYVNFDNIVGSGKAYTNYTTTYPQPTTIFSVEGNDISGAVLKVFSDNGGDAGVYQAILWNGVDRYGQNAGTFSQLIATGGLPPIWRIYEYYFNGVSSYIKTNNVTVITGDAGAFGRKGVTLGDNRLGEFAGKNSVALFAIYTNTLSSTERSNIVYYLGQRYVITTF